MTTFVVFDKMLHALGHRDAVRAKATDARVSTVAAKDHALAIDALAIAELRRRAAQAEVERDRLVAA